jgi:hypothetical protein
VTVTRKITLTPTSPFRYQKRSMRTIGRKKKNPKANHVHCNPDQKNLNLQPVQQANSNPVLVHHSRKIRLYPQKKRFRLRSPVCYRNDVVDVDESYFEVEKSDRNDEGSCIEESSSVDSKDLGHHDNVFGFEFGDVEELCVEVDSRDGYQDKVDDKDEDYVYTFDFDDDEEDKYGIEAESESAVAVTNSSFYRCTKKDISTTLSEMGLMNHLIVLQGSKQQAAMAVITNLANYLMWQRIQSADHWIQDDLKSQVENMLFNLVKDGYNNLPDYVHYLSSVRFLKPTSIMASLNHIKAACQWFVLFRKSNFHLDSSDINALTIVVQSINRGQHKQVSTKNEIYKV